MQLPGLDFNLGQRLQERIKHSLLSLASETCISVRRKVKFEEKELFHGIEVISKTIHFAGEVIMK